VLATLTAATVFQGRQLVEQLAVPAEVRLPWIESPGSVVKTHRSAAAGQSSRRHTTIKLTIRTLRQSPISFRYVPLFSFFLINIKCIKPKAFKSHIAIKKH
jgi:hypothetical protein